MPSTVHAALAVAALGGFVLALWLAAAYLMVRERRAARRLLPALGGRRPALYVLPDPTPAQASPRLRVIEGGKK